MIGEELIPKIVSAARKREPKRAMIHLPAGFSHLAVELEKQLSKFTEPLFWSEGCFGACDIPHLQAKFLKCDLIISVGHAPMRHWNKLQVPVVFVEYQKGKPEDLKVPEVPGKKIVLVASNQFLHLIPEAKSQLGKMGKKVLIGKSGVMCSYPGQVTGCDFVSATQFKGKADSVLLLGEGSFHSSGLAEGSGLPAFQLDPSEGQLRKIEQVISKKINFLYAKEKIGILVSTKPGQEHLTTALALKKKLEKMGKTVLILAGDTFSPSIRNFSDIELLITAGCPRLADDDEAFGIPILPAGEVIKRLAVAQKDAFYGQIK
jgi:diphthamide biosynthesis enzyme Dph1/Dph2-like protein